MFIVWYFVEYLTEVQNDDICLRVLINWITQFTVTLYALAYGYWERLSNFHTCLLTLVIRSPWPCLQAQTYTSYNFIVSWTKCDCYSVHLYSDLIKKQTFLRKHGPHWPPIWSTRRLNIVHVVMTTMQRSSTVLMIEELNTVIMFLIAIMSLINTLDITILIYSQNPEAQPQLVVMLSVEVSRELFLNATKKFIR